MLTNSKKLILLLYYYFQEDEHLLEKDLSKNVRNAVLVRLGEKSILRKMRESLIERMNQS